MGSTVKNAWIAILIAVLFILGFGICQNAQAQTTYWFYQNWDGNGAPNYVGGEAGTWAYWWDSGRYTHSAAHEHDGIKGYIDWQHYYDNWSGDSGYPDHTHTQPERYLFMAYTGEDTDNYAIRLSSGRQHIIVDAPVFGSAEYVYAWSDKYNKNHHWDGLTHVGNMFIDGSREWSFQGGYSGSYSIVYGTGQLFLQESIDLSVFENMTFKFDYGIQVDSVGSFSFLGVRPFGVYRYDNTLYNANTLFINDDLVTFTRPQSVNTKIGMQNRTVIEEGNRVRFSVRGDSIFQIFNVDSRNSGLGGYVQGGSFYLKDGADIEKTIYGTGPTHLGLLYFHNNAAYRGGAIYSEQNLTIQGNTRFTGNIASGAGGAIFMAGGNSESNTLTFDTTNGYIALHDNYVTTDNTVSLFTNRPTADGPYVTNFYQNAGPDKTIMELTYEDVTTSQDVTKIYNVDADNVAKAFTYSMSYSSGTETTNVYEVAANNKLGVGYEFSGSTFTPKVYEIGADERIVPVYTYDDSYNYTIKNFRLGSIGTAGGGYTSVTSLTYKQNSSSSTETAYFLTYTGTVDNGVGTATQPNTTSPVVVYGTSGNFSRFATPSTYISTDYVRLYSDGKYYAANSSGQYIDTSGSVISDPTSGGILVIDTGATNPIVLNYVYSISSPYDTTLYDYTLRSGAHLLTDEAVTEMTTLTEATLATEAVITTTPVDAQRNSIFLNKNTDMVVTGTRGLFIEDGINTGVGAVNEFGNNTLTVELTGSQNPFVQFGSNSKSLLNAELNDGGTVTIKSGELRVLKGGIFETWGRDATFTVEILGKLGGEGLIRAEQGFFINGKIAADSFIYAVPTSLVPQETISRSGTALGHMLLEGNVQFKGATLAIDTSTNSNTNKLKTVTGLETNPLYKFANANDSVLNSDIVQVRELLGVVDSGKIQLSSGEGKSSVTFDSWNPSDGGTLVVTPEVNGGKYVIAASKLGFFDVDTNEEVTNDNIADYFYEVVPSDTVLNTYNRAGTSMYIQRGLLDDTLAGDTREFDLVLQTTNNGNVNLIWTGNINSTWDDTTKNWKRRIVRPDGTVREFGPMSFVKGDYVIFNSEDLIKPERLSVITSNNWTVSGMQVNSGEFKFIGDKITGEANPNFIGVQATGRLDITSTNSEALTVVLLALDTDFEKGTRISNGATVILGTDKSLGVYDSTSLATDGLPKEAGSIYLDNTTATIVTSNTDDPTSRTIKNHFELAGNSELTLNILEGTELTIDGVETHGNQVKHRGGAFFIDSGAKLTRTTEQKLTLSNNRADNGGAIFALDSLEITGNTLFKSNIAANGINVGKGGAIYLEVNEATGTLTFDTTNGDIVFDNNRASGVDNAIYTTGRTVWSIKGNNNLFLNDSIDTNMLNSNIGNELTKEGTGILQFTGVNNFNSSTATRGTVTIKAGTFRLAQTPSEAAPVFTTGGSNAMFSLASGATLAGHGTINVNNSSRTQKIELNGIISPDSDFLYSKLDSANLTDHLVVGELDTITTTKIGTLNFNNSTLLNNATLNIDLGNANQNDAIHVTNGNITLANINNITVASISGTTPSGDYLIVKADSGFFTTSEGTSETNLLAHITDNLSNLSTSSRNSGSLEFRKNSSTNYNELWIVGYGFSNVGLYWTGNTNSNWNTTTTNWQNGAPNGSPDQFYNNDFVIFDSNAVTVNTNSITLAATQTVSGMDVTNGSFDITGTGIIKGVTSGNAPGANGKLTVGGGTTAAELTLGVETQFDEGTELKENGKIVIANDKALGTYNHTNFATDKQGYVNVTGNGTIATDSTNHAITNRFNVAQDKKLTVDVAAEKLTVNGVNVGSDATGVVVLGNNATLEKTGTGTLVFTGNTVTSGGVIYGSGDFTINAAEGDIVFNGNSGDAIYSNGGKVTLKGNNGSRVYLGDTINTTDFDLTGSLTAIIIDEPTTITGTANIGTGINSDKSVLYVASGKNFSATTAFNLKKYAELTGSGTITAGTINLSGTLNPSNDTYSLDANNLIKYTAGTTPDIATLTFNANATLDGATLVVDLGSSNNADFINIGGTLSYGTNKNIIQITNFVDGTFDILTSNTALTLANIGTYFEVDSTSQGERNSYTFQLTNSDKTLQIKSVSGGPIDLYWSGTTNNNTWYQNNTAIQNWLSPELAPNKPQYFLNTDTVNFNDQNYATAKTVILDAGNRTVKNMYIYGDGPGYTFNGTDDSKITGTGNLTIGESKTGTRSSGDAEFNVALDFAGDVNILDSTVTFTKTLKAGSLFIDPSEVTFDDKVEVTGKTTIEDNETKVTYNAELKTNQLRITDAEVTLNAVNTFTNNTQLDGSATVILGNNGSFGGKEVDVAGTADATITTNKEVKISNDINLATNAKLTFETAESNTLTYNGTLNSTGNNDVTLTKAGEGTVIFTEEQTISGNTIIKDGVLQLNDNYTTTGTFTVAENATLTTDGDVTDIKITALTFDVQGTVKVEKGKKLELSGTVNLDGATLTIKLADELDKIALTATTNIDVKGNNFIDTIGDWGEIDENGNDYYVLKADGQITGVTNTNVNDYFKVKNDQKDLSSRQKYALRIVEQDVTTPGDNILILHLDPLHNIHLYWEGAYYSQWNSGTLNWLEDENTTNTTSFADGDYVTFQGNLAKSNDVDLSNNSPIVSGMEIKDGNFFFYGVGTLIGNTTTGNYTAKTGRLDITGNGSLNLSVATKFEKGITISGQREITIGNDDALGDAGNKAEIKNDSDVTFKNDGQDRKIKSNVTLGTNTKLTVNTATNDLAFNGALTGNGTIFAKDGNGSVSFAGNNNMLGANGAATINAGTFRVENSGDSFNAGKTFTLKKDATVTGNGTVTATNIELAGNVTPGTDGTVGTLTFKGNTNFNGANLLIDINPSSSTNYDTITVTGSATFANTNTIKLSNWTKGTYDIITATALGDIGNWDIPTINSDRASADVLKNGNILQLIVNSDNARLIWSGNTDSTWDLNTTKNWLNNNKDDIFIDYDAVTFNGLGQGEVNLDQDVTVAQMDITNGNYTFSGGDIYGKAGDIGNGSLNISGGNTTFGSMASPQFVQFDGGINIKDKANVTLLGWFESGDDFTLGENATLNLVPSTGSIVAENGRVTILGNVNLLNPYTDDIHIPSVIVAGENLDTNTLGSKFTKTWGLNSWQASFPSVTQMDLNYTSLTPYQFADINKLGWNMKEAARAVTDVMDSAGDDTIWGNLDAYLHELDTNAKVTSVLDNLRGTEQAADALTIALWDPWTKVYQQLIKREEENVHDRSVNANGQTPGTFQFKNRNVWIESYYRYTDVNGDKNAKKYYENRGGLMLGLDTKVDHSTSLGIAFGFGDPRLNSTFGKIEADDYTLALYSRTRIHDYRLNTFFGFGTQEFKYQRNDALTYDLYKAAYDGNALYASAELLREIDWGNVWMLYPTIALDYQRAWTYSFIEQGGLFGQSVRKGHADRFIGRIGLDSKYRYSNYLNILTRLQAGYLVGGDTHSSIRSSFTGTTPVMSLHGVDLGRTQFNLGIGGEWFVDEIKSLKFFGNYDLDFGKRHAMQTVQLGAHITF